MKIAIEGMDGVGKSTIAKMVADKYKFNYMEKPLAELFGTERVDGMTNLMEFVPNIYNLDNEILRAWFIGLGNLHSFLSHEDEDIVLDRHFASNYFWNGSEKSKPVFKLMKDLISVPDVTIVLYASPETRMKRIYARDSKDYDLSDPEKKVDGYDKMIDFLDEMDIPYVMVDTEDKSIEEVFEEVDKIVNKKVKEVKGAARVKKRA